jgi:hypothetical protein
MSAAMTWKCRRRFAAGLRSLAAMVMAALPVASAIAQSPIGKIDDVVVLEAGLGPEKDGCARFLPTARDVRRFFERSIVISARQQHDFFDHGPCRARGTLSTAFGEWIWEMRNLGTGELRSITDDVFLVGDPSQLSPLGVDE